MTLSGGGEVEGGRTLVVSGEEKALGELTCRGAGRGFVVQGECWPPGGVDLVLALPSVSHPRGSPSQHRHKRQRFRQPQASLALKSNTATLSSTGKHDNIHYSCDALRRVSCLLAQIQCATQQALLLPSISLAPNAPSGRVAHDPNICQTTRIRMIHLQRVVGGLTTTATGGSPACLVRPSSVAASAASVLFPPDCPRCSVAVL